MFSTSIKDINRLRKELNRLLSKGIIRLRKENRLLSKGMSSIYLKISLKNVSPGQFSGSSNSNRSH